jgi:hypothetical protein
MTMTNRAFDTFATAARQQSPSIAPGPVAAPANFSRNSAGLRRETTSKPRQAIRIFLAVSSEGDAETEAATTEHANARNVVVKEAVSGGP